MIARYAAVAVLVATLGCGREEQGAVAGAEPRVRHRIRPAVPAATAPVIMFVGTSLTAGLGVEPDQAYPAIIQQKIDSAGLAYRVVNAGVSGETSAGALRRIDWLLREPVAVLVLETGANDGLRGQDPDSIRGNIQAIIDRVHATQPAARILLVGMNAMPNLGRAYATRFEAIYPGGRAGERLARRPGPARGRGRCRLAQPAGRHSSHARRAQETGRQRMADAAPAARPIKLIAFAASLRRDSLNRRLLAQAVLAARAAGCRRSRCTTSATSSFRPTTRTCRRQRESPMRCSSWAASCTAC